MKKKKRVLVLSDMHCGHYSGLVPPSEHLRGAKKTRDTQAIKMWNWFANTVKSLGKIDICIHNGDAIDGNGHRSGGTELITTDRKEQVNLAVECLKYTKADEFYLTYGTPYHTGDQEDFEEVLADNMDATIHGHLFLKIFNTVFDIKHKIGGGDSPASSFTSLAKAKMWNRYWKDLQGQPNSDVIIRSHAHIYDFCGNDEYLAMITPGLQGFGSKYGVRQCQRVIKVGLVWFDVDENGFDFDASIMKYEVAQKGQILEPRIK